MEIHGGHDAGNLRRAGYLAEQGRQVLPRLAAAVDHISRLARRRPGIERPAGAPPVAAARVGIALPCLPMGPVRVSVEIPLPLERVWAEASRLDRHAEWMADARSIVFLGTARSGVGTRMRVETGFGPLRATDIIEVTAWEPPRRIAVAHRGRFTGWGRFLLDSSGPGATRFTWEEQVRFPWYLGGPLGALAARPVFYLVWRRNLERFRSRLTSP